MILKLPAVRKQVEDAVLRVDGSWGHARLAVSKLEGNLQPFRPAKLAKVATRNRYPHFAEPRQVFGMTSEVPHHIFLPGDEEEALLETYGQLSLA